MDMSSLKLDALSSSAKNSPVSNEYKIKIW